MGTTQKPTTDQNTVVELNTSRYIHNITPVPEIYIAGTIAEEWAGRPPKPEEQGVVCEVLSSRKVREAIAMQSHQHGCLNMI